MALFLRDIACYLPEQTLSNAKLGESYPHWDMKQVEQRAGVLERRVAGPQETALDLARQACRALFARHPDLPEKLDGLIFCTQSGDYPMPSNSALLHRDLGLGTRVFAFDFNLACSGFVYGLLIAEGLVATGTCKNVLLVNGDTYSKYIHPEDRSARVLFGDGAAVSWLSGEGPGLKLIGGVAETAGKYFDKFIVPAGGFRNPRSPETALVREDASGNRRSDEHIQMDGLGVLNFVTSNVPRQVRALLDKLRLTSDDIAFFVFHQASKMALDSLGRLLKVPSDRLFTNLEKWGNTVSASIPIALHDAMRSGRLPPGKILISGFGVGFSWATCVLENGSPAEGPCPPNEA